MQKENDPTSLSVEELESRLDNFDPGVRRQALEELASRNQGAAAVDPDASFNLHYHTFFSYNPNNESPSHFAWLARKRGLSMGGIVDFDVLDGMQEFLDAGKLLGLPVGVSIESRVFIPEFSDRVINSPGEPGIAYHMGNGFTNLPSDADAQAFLIKMRKDAEQRNRDLVDRVNAFTAPLGLDYDKDVLPLVPNGNATERHLCEAYANKAAVQFGSEVEAFWCEKLGCTADDLDLPAGPALQGMIRSKTMKRGGAGYVQPGEGAFPVMADMNRFSAACGAIPAMAWLNGTTDGELALDELFEVHQAHGTQALNIIPDRNFTPGEKDVKLQNLYDVVEKAESCDFPVIIGTEMNSPGLKFVDDFAAPELAPVIPAFFKGARICYGHTVLKQELDLGYMSDWAVSAFPSRSDRNAFYHEVGVRMTPGNENVLSGLDAGPSPEAVLSAL